jgi:SHS2 domain-containing protein
MLGERAGTTESLDGRFILGHIGPISHFCNASLYLLERELAVSPYMEARASGFTDGARIVVRQDVLRGRVEEEEHKGNVAASSDLEQLLHSMTESVLVHESAHILFDGARVSRGTDGVTLWRSAAREDLLRFAQIPHTLEEFQAAFAEYFGEKNTRINVMMGPAFDIRRPADGFTVERELAALRSEGLLFVDRDHRYYSTIHGRGQPWTL